MVKSMLQRFGGKNFRSEAACELRTAGVINMEVGALQQMLTRLRQVQEDLATTSEQVAVEASAGGGMVTVKMNGQKQVLEVKIEPQVFADKDQEMLQDLVRAAVNEAARKVDEELANQAALQKLEDSRHHQYQRPTRRGDSSRAEQRSENL